MLVGKGDADKITGATKSHPPSGFFKQSWRPMMLRYLLHTAMAGGASYSPVDRLEFVTGGQTFDLPGHPRVVPTEGHTKGHFSVHMPERGTLFTGDALVNFDYTTGQRGPKLHRFNEDRRSARAALDKLGSLEATTLLFGHGASWDSGVHVAIEQARERDAIGA